MSIDSVDFLPLRKRLQVLLSEESEDSIATTMIPIHQPKSLGLQSETANNVQKLRTENLTSTNESEFAMCNGNKIIPQKWASIPFSSKLYALQKAATCAY